MSDGRIADVSDDNLDDGMPSSIVPARPYGWVGLPITTLSIPVLGIGLGALCVALAFGVAGSILGFPVALAAFENAMAGLGRDPTSPDSRLVLSVLSILVYVAVAAVIIGFARLRGGRAWRDLVGWNPWSPIKAKRSFWIIVGVTLVFSLLANEALSVYYPPSRDWVTLPKGALAIALFFILAAVCAPLTEELFFRGWLYTGLRARIGRWGALALSSTLFALAHYEPTLLYALAVLPVGIALGLIREREHSLKASMSFHSLFNTIAFVLICLGV